jgi:phosphoglycolate phosphatase
MSEIAKPDNAWYIEILNKSVKKGRLKFAIFDFDGTISQIRAGWQEVMKSYFLETMMNALNNENEASMLTCVHDFVDYNTGKQTIYQCIALHDEIKIRGGIPEEPQNYKDEYHRRLLEKIQYRLTGLENKKLDRCDWVVPGVYELLSTLRSLGITLILASGTDELFVLNEAKLLGVTDFFNGGIFGAQPEYKLFSKKIVIENIIRRNSLNGSELVGFGDGYVEIENVKQCGGFAVGVASDEKNRSGVDQWKRRRLVKANADIIIPDFSETNTLITYLF